MQHDAEQSPTRPILIHGRFSADTAPAGTPWKEVSGLTKTEAEELLDWLECHGRTTRALPLVSHRGFAVRFQ